MFLRFVHHSPCVSWLQQPMFINVVPETCLTPVNPD